MARQCAPEIYAQDLDFAVWQLAIDLRVVEFGIGRHTSCEIDRVAQVRFTVGQVLAGIANLAADHDFGGIFEVVPAEDADRIERLQRGNTPLPAQRIFQVES